MLCVQQGSCGNAAECPEARRAIACLCGGASGVQLTDGYCRLMAESSTLMRRRSKDDILAQIRDLQSEMASLENGRSGGAAELSNKSN